MCKKFCRFITPYNIINYKSRNKDFSIEFYKTIVYNKNMVKILHTLIKPQYKTPIPSSNIRRKEDEYITKRFTKGINP